MTFKDRVRAQSRDQRTAVNRWTGDSGRFTRLHKRLLASEASNQTETFLTFYAHQSSLLFPTGTFPHAKLSDSPPSYQRGT